MTIMTLQPLIYSDNYQIHKCFLVPALSQIDNTWKLMVVDDGDDYVKIYCDVLLGHIHYKHYDLNKINIDFISRILSLL